MFMKPGTITVTVEQEPGGRYYAAVRWTRAGGQEGSMRLLPGSVRNSAHAVRRLSRLHLVRVERMHASMLAALASRQISVWPGGPGA